MRERLCSAECKGQYRTAAEYFSRQRKLSFSQLLVFVLGNSRSSLQAELDEYMEILHGRGQSMSISKQGVFEARTHFKAAVFVDLSEKLLSMYYADDQIGTYKGYRLLCVDGSTVQLPRSAQLLGQYGNNTGGVHPLARMSVLYDVINHMVLKADLEPFAVSENVLAQQQLQSLCAQQSIHRDIVLFDRQYASLPLMLYLHQQGKDFLMRLPARSSGVAREIREFLRTRANCTDAVVELDLQKPERYRTQQIAQYMAAHQQSADQLGRTLAVRVVVYRLPTGEDEVLLTSLTNSDGFGVEELGELYCRRWNVETRYHQLKEVLQIENFTGRSPLIIAQDFHASILLSNLQALALHDLQEELQQYNADKQRKYCYKINDSLAFFQLRGRLIALLLGQGDIQDIMDALQQNILRQKVPIRPGRSFARERRHPHKKFAFNKKRPFA